MVSFTRWLITFLYTAIMAIMKQHLLDQFRKGQGDSNEKCAICKISLVNFTFKTWNLRSAISKEFFFVFYFAAPRTILSRHRGGSLTLPMLILCVISFQPESHRELNKVVHLSLLERPIGCKPEHLLIHLQRLSPLGYSTEII